MQFTQRLNYVSDSDTVLGLFSSQEYFEQKYSKIKTHSFNVESYSKDDNASRIVMKLEVPMSVPIPGFAKKFVGDTTKLTETDAWDLNNKTGKISADIAGVPVDASADMRLEDTAHGSVNVLDWTVKCSVPLIGKKLEKLIAEDIQSKAAEDERVTNEILKAG